MHNVLKYILVGILLLLLVLIRAFEDVLFYDPYLTFFENDYLYLDSPRREIAKLVLNTTMRFALNTLIPLGILFLIFKDKSIIEFSVLIYVAAYVLLLIPFLYFVINPKQEDYYMFFNIRRFLIQPLLLIILLPALYYQNLKR